MVAGRLAGALRRDSASNSGASGGMANGSQGTKPAGSSGPRRGIAQASPGVVGVVAVAAIIALLTLVTYGEVREGVFLGLIVFILFGALVPPVAIVLGVVMIIAIFYRGGGTALFGWLGSLAGAQAPATPVKPEIGEAVNQYAGGDRQIGRVR